MKPSELHRLASPPWKSRLVVRHGEILRWRRSAISLREIARRLTESGTPISHAGLASFLAARKGTELTPKVEPVLPIPRIVQSGRLVLTPITAAPVERKASLEAANKKPLMDKSKLPEYLRDSVG